MSTSSEAPRAVLQGGARVFVAGHRGLVGRALVRALEARDVEIVVRDRAALDLMDPAAVRRIFDDVRPDLVLMAAGRVGGIEANRSAPVEFLYENLVMGANVVQAAAESAVEKLVYLGSSCIYPKLAPQPITEDSLLTGALEPTNEGYAIAKIAALKLCEYHHRQYGRRFVSAMPTNLYGPFDRFHPEHSHVVPGLLRRFHGAAGAGAPSVTVWGSGTPRRELMYVDDLAQAVLRIAEAYEAPETVNAGSGEEFTIAEIARRVAEAVGFEGALEFDPSKPDGTPRKALDTSRLYGLGWRPAVTLQEGLRRTHAWALEHGAYET